MVEKSFNGSGMKLIQGAKSIAELQNQEIDVVLIWDGMMINSLQYFDVLYGNLQWTK